MRPRRLSLFHLSLLVVALILIEARPAHAAAFEVEVLASEAVSDFPTTMTFDLEFEASRDVVEADLLYSLARDETLTQVAGVLGPDRPGTATATLDMAVYFVPAGVDLTYQWRLTSSDGAEVETPPVTTVWLDTRYEWVSSKSAAIEVYTYAADEAFREAILESAQTTTDRLAGEFGLSEVLPIRIWVYETGRDFSGTQASNSQDWVAGNAYPDLQLILAVVRNGNSAEIGRIIPHEISHQLFAQATANPFNHPAIWIDEGLAVLNQVGSKDRYFERAREAHERDELPSLRALNSNFPVDRDLAALAYAQSASVMRFVIERFGEESISRITAAYREGNSHDDVLRQAIGLDIDELDAAWREWLPQQASSSGGTAALARALLYGVPAVGAAVYLVGRRFVSKPGTPEEIAA